MKESFSSPESEKEIKREEVIDTYRKFVERGITNPDDLDLEDPEVQEANKLFYQWQAQEDAKAGEDEELILRTNVAKTMFYVDAGFTDPEYLNEILREWLMQDAQNAEKQEDNPQRAQTRQHIAAAIKKVRRIMNPEIPNPEIKEPSQFAKQVIAKALEIGEVLKRRQRDGLSVEHKNEDEYDPVTNADKEADNLWREFIQENFPNDLILSEESDDIPTSYGDKRVWMVDPLDSTKAYIKGEDGYSILVGMMQGDEILFGLAYAPARNQLFYAERGQGAFERQADGTFKQIHVSGVTDLAEATVIVRGAGAKDRRPLDEALEALPVKGFIRDSCMRVSRVANGEAETQVNTNFRASKWDTLGPQLIVEEAGGVMTDFDGNPLDYHQEGLRWERSFISANNPEIQREILIEINKEKLKNR